MLLSILKMVHSYKWLEYDVFMYSLILIVSNITRKNCKFVCAFFLDDRYKSKVSNCSILIKVVLARYIYLSLNENFFSEKKTPHNRLQQLSYMYYNFIFNILNLSFNKIKLFKNNVTLYKLNKVRN